MRYTTILFDLDGTLSDPLPGIAAAAGYALEKLHLPPLSLDRIRPMIGPPLEQGLHAVCGVPKERLVAAVALYREYYFDRGWRENTLYPGIAELLKTLDEAGAVLAVATFKPESITRKIVNHFRLSKQISAIAGAEKSDDGTKRGIIGHLLQELGAAPDRAVMVGDRDKDMEGAISCGIACIGVQWGYAEPGELDIAGACAASPDSLLRQLIRS